MMDITDPGLMWGLGSRDSMKIREWPGVAGRCGDGLWELAGGGGTMTGRLVGHCPRFPSHSVSTVQPDTHHIPLVIYDLHYHNWEISV